MPSPGRPRAQPHQWQQTQQHRFPQPEYPPGLYRPLIDVLRRRGQDYLHLPNLADENSRIPGFSEWWEIHEGIDILAAALKGQTPKTEVDRANSYHYDDIDSSHLGETVRFGSKWLGYRPPLPPDLRAKLEFTLSAIEAEALPLGRNIEMNQFRLRRGDPRGQDERALGEARDQYGKKWLAAVRNCVRDVELYQTGMMGKALRDEEYRLAGLRSRRTWNGGKL